MRLVCETKNEYAFLVHKKQKINEFSFQVCISLSTCICIVYTSVFIIVFFIYFKSNIYNQPYINVVLNIFHLILCGAVWSREIENTVTQLVARTMYVAIHNFYLFKAFDCIGNHSSSRQKASMLIWYLWM